MKGTPVSERYRWLSKWSPGRWEEGGRRSAKERWVNDVFHPSAFRSFECVAMKERAFMWLVRPRHNKYLGNAGEGPI